MDLACRLARLGHFPMIWTPRLRRFVGAPVLAAGIPLVSSLGDLPFVPDIIHGHHYLETIEALQRFPGVSAIHVCHSGYWWHDAPPRHPRIRRYVAVDEFCRERLSESGWINDSQIQVIRNAVDLNRHTPRPPLPPRPRRALVFSNYAGTGTHSEPVQEACRRLGIETEVIGSGAGKPCRDPERLLPGFDLVFAKARCALEAMATGCAVIVCDTSGLGTMVTSANVRELRRWNFGFRVLDRPLSPELIMEEIRRYDSRDAAQVSSYIREDAGLDNAVERYLGLYRIVLDEQQPVSEDVDWHPATVRLQVDDQNALRLRFSTVPQSCTPGRHFTLGIGLDNGTTAPVVTAAPWPCLLMYRWIDGRTGEMAVEQGLRTIIQPPAWPGMESTYSLRVIAPSQPGDYILRATIIQEGWRWLDTLAPAVYAEAPVKVLSNEVV